MTDRPRADAGWFRVASATAGTELRRWRRQRVAVAAALVLPLAMAVLVSLALGAEVGDFSATFALVDEDRGPAAEAFVDEALGAPALRDVVEVEEVATETAARRLVDDGEVDAAIVLPTGIGRRLASEGRSDIDVVRGDTDPLAGDLAVLLVEQFDIRARARVLAAERRVATAATPEPWPLRVRVTAPGGDHLDAATHYGPTVGLFFVLVAMGSAASQLAADRERGVVERLAAAPVAPSAVVAGRAAAALTVGALSMGTLALAMGLLFGRSWGPPIPVIAVTAAVVLAMGGMAAVVASLARTPDQAQAVSIGVAFVFALASGSLAPPGSSTRPSVAAAVPTTHALDAYTLVSTERVGLAAVSSPIVVLVAFGVAGALATAVVARRLAW